MDIFYMILLVVVFFAFLYVVVKAAVRDGIIEAKASSSQKENNRNEISKITCSHCGNKYDMDYPKCPYCKKLNGPKNEYSKLI